MWLKQFVFIDYKLLDVSLLILDVKTDSVSAGTQCNYCNSDESVRTAVTHS